MGDLTPVMGEIGEAMVSRTQQRFLTGTGPDGEPWEPSGRALAEGGKTLVDHGILRSSIDYKAGSGGVEIGSNLVYAAIQELGGDAGRGGSVHLPARPYLGLDDADQDEIADIVDDWLRGALA